MISTEEARESRTRVRFDIAAADLDNKVRGFGRASPRTRRTPSTNPCSLRLVACAHSCFQDWFGKSDGFLVLSRQRPDGTWEKVHKVLWWAMLEDGWDDEWEAGQGRPGRDDWI